MLNHSIESWVSLGVLLGYLALLVSKLVGAPACPSRVFGGLVALSITIIGVITLITRVHTSIISEVTAIAAFGPAGRLLLGVLLVLVVLGHVVLLVALVQRRLAANGRRDDRGRDPEAASRRSRAVLPDRMEGS